MIQYELHLEGSNAAVMWTPDDHTSGNTLSSPPRVVMYADQVWTFYRFGAPKIPGNRCATYRKATVVLRLAPGEYKG